MKDIIDGYKNGEKMILTDKEIAEKASEIADRYYSVYDAAIRMGKDCTEHYEELISAGIKWKTLINAVQKENEGYSQENIDDGMTAEAIGYRVLNMIKS